MTHRALLLGGLARGRTTISRPLDAADTRASAAVVAALGARVDWQGERLTVEGCPQPRSPAEALDCANSGTTARLSAGLLAPRAGTWLLDGDDSLRRRPMGRVVEPLTALGARLEATRAAPDDGGGDDLRLPLRVSGSPLRGGDIQVPVPSAQVKSALMLAGLAADAPLTVHQATPTRDHTERLLPRFGAELQVDPGAVTVWPGPLSGASLAVPGDPSSAAFALVAALLLPGSRLTLREVGLWPRRGGLLLALQQAGAPLEVLALRDRDGDPVADLHVEAGTWKAITVRARDVPDLVDELPLLALVAARAEGTSRLQGLAELRVKESDRLAGLVALLSDLGVPTEQDGDDLTVTGVPALRGPPRQVDHPDHRLAMTAALATLVTTGRLPDPPSAAVSWPTFAADLSACLQD